MSTAPIKQILSTPVALLRPSDNKEKGAFSDKQDGWFYTLALKSGQSFVVCLDKKEEIFTLRPQNNLLPNLTQIEWKKRHAYDDLGYDTTCTTTASASKEEKAAYAEILTPISDERPNSLTKVFFKHYLYPPLLERMIELKSALTVCENLQQTLAKAQKKLHSLQVTGEKSPINQSIQKKQQERRQNG